VQPGQLLVVGRQHDVASPGERLDLLALGQDAVEQVDDPVERVGGMHPPCLAPPT
jgi:hypothetical protein